MTIKGDTTERAIRRLKCTTTGTVLIKYPLLSPLGDTSFFRDNTRPAHSTVVQATEL